MPSAPPEEIVVLVVEDKMAMRKIIKSVLQQVGVKSILEAGDGLEALDMLRKRNKRHSGKGQPGADTSSAKRIDFLICDWGMPRMSGLELLKIVRQDANLKSLPFMMLTAQTDRAQILHAMELGVTDYIIKPFTTSVLEAKLRAILAGAKPPVSS
jgi:two-component system chemotaxis response regulator CheY